ncbi:permease [Aestuariibacter salexigens]|uniref:permease n=1 Tax=Aestuariibacter salexigens TaxID=226010 RepID=UPI00068830A7|nr:permease [Aestuariibacter salexigens]
MSNSCCHQHPTPPDQRWWQKPDWMLTICGAVVLISYAAYWLAGQSLASQFPSLYHFSHSVFELLNTMWWGVLLGIIMLSLLTRIPRDLVIAALGNKAGIGGLCRATAAGVMLDLCSHGILMVGAKLYERGASAGQVMAFLIASPWNSFSLTLILVALIGLGWTLMYILLSVVIAIATGMIFDYLVKQQVLVENPNRQTLSDDFQFWHQVKTYWHSSTISTKDVITMFTQGVIESKMVVRWLLLGIVLAAVVRTFVSADQFANLFGPTLIGLTLTVLAATIIEVCSEGSTPLAADIANNANAPGNGFAFLMSGVSTDYTEIMVIKSFTQSWKFALMLPIITLPQIFVIALALNTF